MIIQKTVALGIVALVFPLACGEGADTSNGSSAAESGGPTTVASDAALPACDSETEGELFFVKGTSQLLLCEGGEFTILNVPGDAGADGVDGPTGAEGPSGTQGPSGADGADGFGVTIEDEAPGSNCAEGGLKVTGSLGTSYVCNGNDAPSLVVIEPTIEQSSVTCLSAAGGAGGEGAAEPECFNWLGTLDDEPSDPQEGDAFYWRGVGTACLWSDGDWHVMAQTETPRLGGCDPYTRVFVPLGTFSGNLGGVAGADALCQQRAEDAALGGTWRAWLSDGLGNSPDANFEHQTYTYRRLDGAVVATDWEDLIDGSHAVHMGVTAYNSNNYGKTATGTLIDGTASADHCNNWTSDTGNGRVGLSAQTDNRWTSSGSSTCAGDLRLYCFEQ